MVDNIGNPSGQPELFDMPKIQNGDLMGPNGDPKTGKGPHGDRVPQMGTHVGAVGVHTRAALLKQ